MLNREISKFLLLAVLLLPPTQSLAGENEGDLWGKLFALLRPFGSYDGELSVAINKTTQKSGVSDVLPRIYLVNYKEGSLLEWSSGRGAVEPAVCPDGEKIYLRRGKRIEHATIDRSTSSPTIANTSNRINDVSIKHIYACTKNEDSASSGYLLWVQFAENNYGILHHTGDKIEKQKLPAEFSSHAPHQILTGLAKLQGVREDGKHAWVRDGKLVIAATPMHDQPESYFDQLLFGGNPVWINATDYIVVSGLKD